MIEYITETGFFGVLWCISFLFFIPIAYNFIKLEKDQSIPVIINFLIVMGLFHLMAKELIGKTRFDSSLMIIKDAWFIMGHTFLSALFIGINKKVLRRDVCSEKLTK